MEGESEVRVGARGTPRDRYYRRGQVHAAGPVAAARECVRLRSCLYVVIGVRKLLLVLQLTRKEALSFIPSLVIPPLGFHQHLYVYFSHFSRSMLFDKVLISS